MLTPGFDSRFHIIHFVLELANNMLVIINFSILAKNLFIGLSVILNFNSTPFEKYTEEN